MKMADTSLGKVQTLRAMFAQKDGPVMGLLPPTNNRIGSRPWKRSMSSLSEDCPETSLPSTEQQIQSINHNAQAAILKLLQQRDVQVKDQLNGVDSARTVPQKPVIGPKPVFARQQCRNAGLNTKHEPATLTNTTTTSPTVTEVKSNKVIPPKPKRNSPLKKLNEASNASKCIESLASHHLYSNGHVVSDRLSNSGTLENGGSPGYTSNHTNLSTNKFQVNGDLSGPNQDSKFENDAKAMSQLSLINSDNYICKSNCKLIRNKLPQRDKLGPAPLKPSKPPHLKLPPIPSLFKPREEFDKPVLDLPPKNKSNSPSPFHGNHILQPRNTVVCPVRPTTAPPVPPSLISSLSNSHFSTSATNFENIKHEKTLVEEIEELYEDTLLGRNGENAFHHSSFSSAKEEGEFDDLYDDAMHSRDLESVPPCPPKPRNPPPPPPSLYLDPIGNTISEELYQDAFEASDEEFYEEMPTDLPEEKELEKLRREKQKRIRKENKEKEKKEKEMEKVKKKFGILGDEIPIDAGIVKSDSRGGRCDLQVCRGEKVYILRIEGNPAGKWLVRNSKGKFGYVELTNIEVDPDSVKSVMIERRASVISSCNSEELYCEAYSEQEAIYETTY